jgi:CheY-like chemotaxis protein
MILELKRILLVEDSENDVELTLSALSEYNLANDVDVVRNGAEALDYLHRRGNFAGRASGNPTLVLLDLKLPKIDGIEVLRRIRSSDELKMIPVVILTSSREEKDLIATYELQVNAYVVKPVAFHEFIEAVKQIGGFWGVLNEGPPPPMRKPFDS